MDDGLFRTAQSPCPSIVPALPEIGSNRHAPALTFKPEDYLHFLEDSDWTESQKREFIDALWTIVVGFVDLGFHIHPVQQVKTASQTLEVDSPIMLVCENNSDATKNTAAAPNILAAKGSES
jgi:hypothetical protein